MWSRRHVLFTLAILAISVFIVGIGFPKHALATTGINQELSFEGKIVNSSGTNITDGTYNMEFNIYTGCTNNTGTGCTSVWTEDWLVSASQGVPFTSGTFQVNLGSITAFGTSVPWNTYPLYLSLQIGSTSSCTPAGNFTANCGGDGVMSPYILLTSTPYSLNSNELGGLTASQYGQLAAANTFQPTTNVTGLTVMQNSAGSPTADIFDVQTANNTDAIQVAGPSLNNANVTINPVGSGNNLNLGTANQSETVSIGDTTLSTGTQTIDIGDSSTSGGTTNVNIGNTNAGTVTLQSNGTINVGNNALAQTLNIGNTTGATAVTVNAGTGNLDLGGGGVANTIAIGNASGAKAQTIDIGEGNTTSGASEAINIGSTSTSSTIVIGSTTAGNVTLQSAATISIGNNAVAQTLSIGNATGATTVSVNAGTGNLYLGNGGVANTVQIGNTSGAVAQTIDIGNNATASSTSTVTIGSTIGSSATTVTAGSGNVSLKSSQVIVGVGSTGESTPDLLTLDNGSSSSDPTGVAGAMYYNSYSGNFRCYEAGAWENCLDGLLDSYTSFTASNTASSSVTLYSPPVYTMPANYCTVGRVVHVYAAGYLNTSATTGQELEMDIYLGGNKITLLPGLSANVIAASQTNSAWSINGYIMCGSNPGSSVIVYGSMQFVMPTTATTNIVENGASLNTATFDFDTATSNTIQIGTTWKNTDSSTTLNVTQFVVEGY